MLHLFKAKFWNGSSWLLTLSVALVIVIFIYLIIHGSAPKCDCDKKCYNGHEYLQLDKRQIQDVNNLLNHYPDTIKATGRRAARDTNQRATDTTAQADNVKVIGYNKVRMLMDFLETEYDDQLDSIQKCKLDSLLVKMDTRDAATYLSRKKFKICSYFFLVGPGMYIEVLLWSIIGVLCSLIYYVSLANRLQLKPEDGDNTVSAFDISEIPGQAAKLLYAPISTLILVLGYNFIATDDTMIDIGVGKGVLLFSFIAGFYSGRVMKFLDKLKDLLLPVSSVEDGKKDTQAAGKPLATVTATLKLAPALATIAQGAVITQSGFQTASVELTSEDGKTGFKLKNTTADQSAVFTAEKIPFGKYQIKAALTFRQANAAPQQDTVLNLKGSKAVEIKEATQAIEVILDKTE